MAKTLSAVRHAIRLSEPPVDCSYQRTTPQLQHRVRDEACRQTVPAQSTALTITPNTDTGMLPPHLYNYCGQISPQHYITHTNMGATTSALLPSTWSSGHLLASRL